MKYYLAYGSNLNKWQMKHRCPDAVPVGTVTIKDYELVFRGVATIEPKRGAEVQCGIWKISAHWKSWRLSGNTSAKPTAKDS